MLRSFGIALALILIVVVVFPLPAWVAKVRRHPNFREICYLNILLVWTWIGWFVLLIWAASGKESEKVRRLRERFKR